VLTANASCAQTAVRDWLAGRAVPERCRRPLPLLAPLGPYPSGGKHLTATRTLRIVEETVQEAEATWILAADVSSTRVAGLYGGLLRMGGERALVLRDYSIARGVSVSGKLRLTRYSQPLTFAGTVTVSAPPPCRAR
jgi:hypothetical protein